MAVSQRRDPNGIATDEKCDINGIDVLSADAARASKQDIANASLSSLDAKSPTLVGGKVPVAIDGGVSITGTVAVSDGSGALTVDGSVTVGSSALPSGAATSALQGAGLPSALTSGGGVKTGLVDAIPAGTNTIGKIDQGIGGASAWKVDGSAVTQPVSIAATVAISAASLPLGTGAATSAKQDTEIASLASVDAGIPAALGQAIAASSMPVVLPAAQSPGAIAQDTSVDQVEGYLDGVETLLTSVRDQGTIGTAFASTTATVTSTAGQLPSFAAPRGFTIQNPSGNLRSIFIGSSSGVTTSNGYEIAPGGPEDFPLDNANKLYAIAASGNNTIIIAEIH